MDQTTVAFETKCYERDWQFIVNERYLRSVISNCQHPFDHRVLYLNNFQDYRPAIRAAEKLLTADVIDEFCVVEDYAASALEAFGLTRESLAHGYVYSIAELVGIYRCKSDYLLHFSGDSRMESGAPRWIDDAIHVMEQRPEVLVANPLGNSEHREAQYRAFGEDANWYYSCGFSDQCYLVNVNSVRKEEVYSETHPASERFPAYGGELFEKRVDAYMHNHKLQRITSKHAGYVHENYFPIGRGEWLRRQRMQKIHHLSLLAKMIAAGRWRDGVQDVVDAGKRLYMRGRGG